MEAIIMRTPPNYVMADRLAAFVPTCGSISSRDAQAMLMREFGIQGVRADAVIQIARLRDQIAVEHGGATIRRRINVKA